MPVEMIGWIAPRVSSELIPPSGPPFDATVIAETARIHERAGFDRVLIGYFSDAPDGFLVGAHAASVTERLSFLLAHRPGFVAPPLAARKLATLDQLSDGRLAVPIRPRTATGPTTRPVIAAPQSTSRFCAGPGPSRRRSTTRASSTGPEGPIPKSVAGSSRISRSMVAAAPTQRSGRWPRMSMSSCCGANR
jgi:hypothetical protein